MKTPKLWTMSYPVLKEPTGCTNYFQFISVISLYMFRAGLLLIIWRYNYVRIYTNCSIYTVVPPDNEQQAYSKHVEVNY